MKISSLDYSTYAAAMFDLMTVMMPSYGGLYYKYCGSEVSTYLREE